MVSRLHKYPSSGGWYALLLYATTVVILARDVLQHLTDSILGYAVTDNFYNVWYVWWFKHAVETGHDPGHTHLIYALLPSVQVFVEYWVPNVTAFLFQQVTGPLPAYNLTVLLSFVLAGYTMYLLAGAYVDSWLARFAAGFLYTFSTYHFFRAVAHLGVLTIEWLPLCAWRIVVFYRTPTTRNAILAGLGLALVPLSDIYYLPYFAVPFMALFVGRMLIWDRPWFSSRRHLALAGLVLLVAVALAGPLLSGYVHVDPDIRGALQAASDDSTSRYSADLLAFVLPNPTNPWLGHLTRSTYGHMRSDQLSEEAVFLGYPTLLLSVAALLSRKNRRRGASFWVVVAVAGVLLALGPHQRAGGRDLASIPLYAAIYSWNPLSAFRAPDRLIVLALLATSVLSAYAVEGAAFRSHGRWRGLLWLSVVGALGLSLSQAAVFSVSFPRIPAQVPSIYTQIARGGGGLLLELPVVVDAPQYQYYQTVHHRPLVNGYASRVSPRMIRSVQNLPSMAYLNPAGQRSRRQLHAGYLRVAGSRFRSALHRRHIAYVVLNNWLYTPREYRQVTHFLQVSLGSPSYRDPVYWTVAWRVPDGH